MNFNRKEERDLLVKSIPRAKLNIQRMKIHVGENFSELLLLLILGIGVHSAPLILPWSLILDPCSSLSSGYSSLFSLLFPSLQWVCFSPCSSLLWVLSLYPSDKPRNLQWWGSHFLLSLRCIYRNTKMAWFRISGNAFQFFLHFKLIILSLSSHFCFHFILYHFY